MLKEAYVIGVYPAESSAWVVDKPGSETGTWVRRDGSAVSQTPSSSELQGMMTRTFMDVDHAIRLMRAEPAEEDKDVVMETKSEDDAEKEEGQDNPAEFEGLPQEIVQQLKTPAMMREAFDFSALVKHD